jgi:hypothetical protein
MLTEYNPSSEEIVQPRNLLGRMRETMIQWAPHLFVRADLRYHNGRVVVVRPKSRKASFDAGAYKV